MLQETNLNPHENRKKTVEGNYVITKDIINRVG